MAKFSVFFDGAVYSIRIEKNIMGGLKYHISKGKGCVVAEYNSFDKEPEDLKLARYSFELAGLIALDTEPLEDLGLRNDDQLRFMKCLIEAGKEVLINELKKQEEQWKMKK